MKRAGKCINKKAYAFRSDAIDVAKKIYTKKGLLLSVYECSTCLDFHLTSKYCGSKMKKTLIGTTPRKGSIETIKRRERKKRHNLMCGLVAKLLIDVFSNPQPKSFQAKILGIIIYGGR